ncbi:MAG: hypothetical protein P8Z80_01765 [Pseudolabrys sp.]
MNNEKAKKRTNGIELEYEFDESPQKIWRAITVPALREQWLPKEALADSEAVSITPGEEVRYRMRDRAPPYLESTVTFRIAPNPSGGTSLWVTHELTDLRYSRMTKAAANGNSPAIMLAA